MMGFWVELFLYGLCAFLGAQLPDNRQSPASNWRTISPSGPSPPPALKYPASAEYISAYDFLFPSALPTPTEKTAQMYQDAFQVLLRYETDPPAVTTDPPAAATDSPVAAAKKSRANPPATANPPEPEDDDVEAQSSRLQWFADFLFGVMIILLVIFMTLGEPTNFLGFLLSHHRQVFVARGRKNRVLRSTIAALQANPVLFALPPPTSDEDLNDIAKYASGSTQTEGVTYTSVGTSTQAEEATYASAGTQTGATDSASVATQTDAVNYQSVGTQTIPDALPADRDEVSELRAALAKQRQDSDSIIRNLQASLARLGTESGQLRAQLARTSRPAFASPPTGVVPTYAGLAYDPHHNPNPQANAQQLAHNAALQQRQFQPPHWPQPPGWQGYRQQ